MNTLGRYFLFCSLVLVVDVTKISSSTSSSLSCHISHSPAICARPRRAYPPALAAQQPERRGPRTLRTAPGMAGWTAWRSYRGRHPTPT
eukprot:12007150-Alexandrium_andersonii.AAC.1